MEKMLRTWGPLLLTLLLQLAYLSFKFGEIAARLDDHSRRLDRIERFIDTDYIKRGS